MQVKIQNSSDITGTNFIIKFDTTYLQFNQATAGTFLGLADEADFTAALINSNQIKIEYSRKDESSKDGSGTLCNLIFKPKKSGYASVEFYSANLFSHHAELTYTTYGAILNITANIKVKVFLEGAFNGTAMNSAASDYISKAQPYSIAPWNYMESEQVADTFLTNHKNIVDWLLVELRSPNSPDVVIQKKVCFLLTDGSLAELDGTVPLRFSVTGGKYYLAVFHRNHFPLISSAKVSLDIIPNRYDFTTSATASSNHALKEVKEGVYCLISGDTNSDGFINAEDRIEIWNQRNTIGYNKCDIFLDGVINAQDRITIWNNRNTSAK